ncbi:hypothetical protein [Lentiprolixibacter aurantiacus]|uniref:Nuclear transport factor 2 family protein n=1 Tax=Lentiprolixibacter aurantiacus TaxID=2993939 RepID=A0AAE3MHT1_9FLAO|nr:hypothetical protein [Lentiprolixibacter aurantiacus]MCX2718015.1 hypothetical protein [Lentiprolixibacter aurantiacus]
MKKVLFSLILGFFCIGGFAQESSKYHQKVKTIDSTVEALYDVISGPKGQQRDWDFFRYLFHPEAKLVIAGKQEDSTYNSRYITIEEYIESASKWMYENGFYEKELHKVTERFGPIAHVFSSYESFRTAADKTPFMRGINSIQLMYTGDRWMVMNIYFTQETEENPIPEKYLPSRSE